MAVKLYLNRRWLMTQYQTLGKTAAQIAKEQGVSEPTIYNALKTHQLIRNPRKLSR